MSIAIPFVSSDLSPYLASRPFWANDTWTLGLPREIRGSRFSRLRLRRVFDDVLEQTSHNRLGRPIS
jgi:hypothetical protein